jgi:hypothetical protein
MRLISGFKTSLSLRESSADYCFASSFFVTKKGAQRQIRLIRHPSCGPRIQSGPKCRPVLHMRTSISELQLKYMYPKSTRMGYCWRQEFAQVNDKFIGVSKLYDTLSPW